MGQILVVTSGKGGTGKTTLCAGIASCLSQLSQRVLCIDTDVGLRNLDLALGMADIATVPFTEVTSGHISLDDVPMQPKLPGLSLLTAPMTDAVEDAAFAQMLAQARSQFDWVLLDAPAGIGNGFQRAARYADRALTVALADPASLRDAGCAAQLLRQMGVLQIQLVVNRVSRKLYKQLGTTIDDVMDQVGLPLLGMVPEDTDVVLAAVAGKPLVEFTKGGAAEGCRRIARRLLNEKVPLMRIR